MRAVLAAALIAGLSIPSAAFGETAPGTTTEASATDATAADAAGAEGSATDGAATDAEPTMEATSVEATDAPVVDDAPPATTDDSGTPEVTTTDVSAEETVADTPTTDPEAVPDSSTPEGTPQAVPADDPSAVDPEAEAQATTTAVVDDAPPATNADPVQIERPQLAVNDPAGAGNATWEATPQSTEAVTWSIDNLGNPVVWANDGYIFTDGNSFYSFGDAPDSEGPGLEGTTIILDVINASCVIAPTVTYPVFTGVRAYQVSDGTTLAPGSVVSYKPGQTISVTPLMLDGYVYNSDPLTITFADLPAGCVDTDVQLSVQAIPGTGQVQLTNTGTAAAFVQYGDDTTGTTDGTLTIQPGETVTVQSTRASLYFLVSDAAGSRTIIRAVPVIPAATNPPTNPPTGTTNPPAPTGSSNTTQVTVTSNGTTVVTTVGDPQLANTGVQVREAGLLAGGLLLMGMLMLVAGRRKPQES